MNEIKTELDVLCHGCLSADRLLTPLGENYEIFMSLIGNRNQYSVYGTGEIQLCWECKATIKKFRIFQMQVKQAKELLMQYQYGLKTQPIPLSKLSMILKEGHDYDIKSENPKRKKRKSTNTDIICQNLLQQDIKQEIHFEDQKDTEVIYTDVISGDVTEMAPVTAYAIMPDPADRMPDETGNVNTPVETNNVPSELPEITEANIKDDLDYADGVFDNDDFLYDIKMESTKPEKRQRKSMIKRGLKKTPHYWVTRTKLRTANLVEKKQIEWGDIKSYFTTVMFTENEMEQNIFTKERNYTDLKRYPFSCVTCNLGYKSEVDLKRHNNLNHRKPGAAFKCTLCSKVMKTQEALESHWREHTPISKCNLCEQTMRPRGMKQHLNMAHTKLYSCDLCTMTFGTVSSYSLHYKDVHMKFTCDYCKRDFKSKTRVAYHIRHMHVAAFCKDCNRSYLNRTQYLKHCVLLHPTRANRQEEREACFCVECDKQFNSIAQYRKHLKVSVKHNVIKKQSVPCPECGKMFARKVYMKNHYNLYHLKKTRFYCELCDKYFARAFGLRVHNTYVHQKVQKVRDKICDLCGRAFTNNRTMLNHRATHTGERPHKCPYCTAEFIQKYAMQTHMRTQHKHFT